MEDLKARLAILEESPLYFRDFITHGLRREISFDAEEVTVSSKNSRAWKDSVALKQYLQSFHAWAHQLSVSGVHLFLAEEHSEVVRRFLDDVRTSKQRKLIRASTLADIQKRVTLVHPSELNRISDAKRYIYDTYLKIRFSAGAHDKLLEGPFTTHLNSITTSNEGYLGTKHQQLRQSFEQLRQCIGGMCKVSEPHWRHDVTSLRFLCDRLGQNVDTMPGTQRAQALEDWNMLIIAVRQHAIDSIAMARSRDSRAKGLPDQKRDISPPTSRKPLRHFLWAGYRKPVIQSQSRLMFWRLGSRTLRRKLWI
ncbi:MAG: hypothetical protein Q9211_004758 [Gyalolechia sp. 1 TL-2023]